MGQSIKSNYRVPLSKKCVGTKKYRFHLKIGHSNHFYNTKSSDELFLNDYEINFKIDTFEQFTDLIL